MVQRVLSDLGWIERARVTHESIQSEHPFASFEFTQLEHIKSAASFEGAHASTRAVGSCLSTCRMHSTTVTVFFGCIVRSEKCLGPHGGGRGRKGYLPCQYQGVQNTWGEGLVRITDIASFCSSFKLLLYSAV